MWLVNQRGAPTPCRSQSHSRHLRKPWAHCKRGIHDSLSHAARSPPGEIFGDLNRAHQVCKDSPLDEAGFELSVPGEQTAPFREMETVPGGLSRDRRFSREPSVESGFLQPRVTLMQRILISSGGDMLGWFRGGGATIDLVKRWSPRCRPAAPGP
jgi:hypothetical protein